MPIGERKTLSMLKYRTMKALYLVMGMPGVKKDKPDLPSQIDNIRPDRFKKYSQKLITSLWLADFTERHMFIWPIVHDLFSSGFILSKKTLPK